MWLIIWSFEKTYWNTFIFNKKMCWGCGSVVECDFSIVEARGSIPLISIFAFFNYMFFIFLLLLSLFMENFYCVNNKINPISSIFSKTYKISIKQLKISILSYLNKLFSKLKKKNSFYMWILKWLCLIRF